MGRHSHYRSGSIFDKNEIGKKHGHPAACCWVYAVTTGKDPFLLKVVCCAPYPVGLPYLVNEGLHSLSVFRGCELKSHRMFRGKGHERGAEKGILSCGEYLYRAAGTLDREINLAAGASAYPVALHDKNTLRPPGKQMRKIKQFLCVVRYPEEPLLKLLLSYLTVTTPASAILHLLVCKDCLTGGAPVDKGLLPVCYPLFIHLHKQLLLPAVVGNIACCQLPVPVVGKPHLLKLIPHVNDILAGPDRRVAVILYGSILGRHAEGIPPHGMKDVEPLHPFEAPDNITYGVVSHMPHMYAARWIGKHFKKIVLAPCRIFRHLECL